MLGSDIICLMRASLLRSYEEGNEECNFSSPSLDNLKIIIRGHERDGGCEQIQLKKNYCNGVVPHLKSLGINVEDYDYISAQHQKARLVI
jgi:hypothetical protein